MLFLHRQNKGGIQNGSNFNRQIYCQKRKEQNLTQEQLAERLGVSNKTISKWETAKCMPDYTVITKLCEELNITISELMDGEESDGKSVRVYDDEQILDLLRRTQELEKAKSNDDGSSPYRYGNCFAGIVTYIGRFKCQRLLRRTSVGDVHC